MRSTAILTALSSLVVLGAAPAFAQAPLPPPAPAPAQPAQPAPGAAPAPYAPAPYAPAPYAPQPAPYAPAPAPSASPYPAPGAAPAPAPSPTPGASAGASFSFGAGGSGVRGEASTQGTRPQGDEEPESREESLKEQNTLSGSTGLLRTVAASSGAEGTVRFSFRTDWFSGSDFLCNGDSPCLNGGTSDEVTHFGAVFGLSFTPLSWLEANAAVRTYANSNDQGRPKLLQVLGDTTLGVKAFTPKKAGNPFTFGGAADLMLLNGTGGVGLDTKGTGLRFRGLATADLREPHDKGAPVRFHANLGYYIDNSGQLVSDVEDKRGTPITRIERFGLGINRVDQIQFGLGVEGMFQHVRPFAEWNLGVPVNRQGWTCNPGTSFPGDGCLGNDHSLSIAPSTLTLGARAYPWLSPGLKGTEIIAAFDIGTTGTSSFVEEVAPTPKWDLWLGLGWAFDTEATRAPAPPPAPRRMHLTDRKVRGFVHELGKQEGVADAIVRYEGRDITAMATGPDGRFETRRLEPGAYTFSIKAPGYKDSQCTAVVPPVQAPPPPPAPEYPGAPAPATTEPQSVPVYFDLDCALEATPRAGTVIGHVTDADGRKPVEGATVRLVDAQGKEAHATTDASGAFRIENVPPGTAQIKVEAADYLLLAQPIDIRAREEAKPDLSLHKRPKNALVEVGANEIKIKEQVRFDTDSAVISSASTPLLQEIADVIARNARIKKIEIQGHTDNQGDAGRNKQLSEQRAAAVRDWLTSHGVDAGRLTAKGYGPDKPIRSNANAAGRAANRRVQFVILEQEGAAQAPAVQAKPKGGKPAAPKAPQAPAVPKPTQPLPF